MNDLQLCRNQGTAWLPRSTARSRIPNNGAIPSYGRTRRRRIKTPGKKLNSSYQCCIVEKWEVTTGPTNTQQHVLKFIPLQSYYYYWLKLPFPRIKVKFGEGRYAPELRFNPIVSFGSIILVAAFVVWCIIDPIGKLAVKSPWNTLVLDTIVICELRVSYPSLYEIRQKKRLQEF